MTEEEPTIHIDEGWKAQVERERTEAEANAPQPTDATPEEAQPELTRFDMLTSTLAAQTMMALGLAVPEGSEEVIVDLPYAQHLIETLDMLREKTEGNLDEGELANLNEAVSELQRVFAIRAEQVREAEMKAPQTPGIDPNPPFLQS